MTSATTPLAGTEVVEIVQSGTSKKVAVSNFGGSGGTPGGSTTQVQYNNASAFAGSASFAWVEASKYLLVSNDASTYSRPVSDVGILASSTANTSIGVFSYGAAPLAGFRGGSATGTPESPGATGAGTTMCFMAGHLYDGSAWTSASKALITLKSGQDATGSNQGTYITFEVTPLNSTTRAESVRIDPDGNLLIQQQGKGLRVKEGSNAKQGTATLTAGAVTVSNTSVTANSRIFLTSQADGGTPGWLRVSARSAGTSFTITSSSGSDTSTVAYQIFEPA